MKSITLELSNLKFFSKIKKICSKLTKICSKNVNKNSWITSSILISSNLDISKQKRKLNIIFWIPYSTLDGLSNDTSHNSLRLLYRSAKIVWTKKKRFDYIVPPPSRGVGTKNWVNSHQSSQNLWPNQPEQTRNSMGKTRNTCNFP